MKIKHDSLVGSVIECPIAPRNCPPDCCMDEIHELQPKILDHKRRMTEINTQY